MAAGVLFQHDVVLADGLGFFLGGERRLVRREPGCSAGLLSGDGRLGRSSLTRRLFLTVLCLGFRRGDWRGRAASLLVCCSAGRLSTTADPPDDGSARPGASCTATAPCAAFRAVPPSVERAVGRVRRVAVAVRSACVVGAAPAGGEVAGWTGAAGCAEAGPDAGTGRPGGALRRGRGADGVQEELDGELGAEIGPEAPWDRGGIDDGLDAAVEADRVDRRPGAGSRRCRSGRSSPGRRRSPGRASGSGRRSR